MKPSSEIIAEKVKRYRFSFEDHAGVIRMGEELLAEMTVAADKHREKGNDADKMYDRIAKIQGVLELIATDRRLLQTCRKLCTGFQRDFLDKDGNVNPIVEKMPLGEVYFTFESDMKILINNLQKEIA